MKITAKTTLTELSAIISNTLESKNIIATLSGGAAVSIYSKNIYQSADLDFVTAAPIDVLKDALEPLGFKHSGNPRLSVFDHVNTLRNLTRLTRPGKQINLAQTRRPQ